MSRLLGVVTREPVDLSFSMKEAPKHFGALKQNNPDGWGLGWFNDGRAEVQKHEMPISGELAAASDEAQARSTLFVAHVRRSSRMPRAVKNTHPFAQGDWLFAHTGALYPLLEVSVRRLAGRAIPYEGQTDSEGLFHLFLANMEKHNDPVAAIRESVTPVIQDGQFSGLNFLLARAGMLYAFRYATRSADYYSMWWLRRPAGHGLDVSSKDVYARIRSQGLANTDSIMVCSEQVDPGAGWCPVGMGELLVIRNEPTLAAETVRLV